MFPEDVTNWSVAEVTRWVCSDCGSSDPTEVSVDALRPSVDDRFALGFCSACHPARQTAYGLRRGTVNLVRLEDWDQVAFEARAAHRADQALLGKYRRGHHLTPEQMARVKELALLEPDPTGARTDSEAT